MSDELKREGAENPEVTEKVLPDEAAEQKTDEAAEKKTDEATEKKPDSGEEVLPEGMSIFDRQDKGYKPPKKKMKAWVMSVIAVALCLAIGGGVWGVLRYLDRTEPDNSSQTSSAEMTMTLLDFGGYSDTIGEADGLGRGGVENITLANAAGELIFTQGVSETTSTDSNGSESTTKSVGWSITNYENISWDSTAVSGLVSNALTVTAIIKMEDSAKDLESYGLAPEDSEDALSKETATVRVNFKDGTSYTVHIGDWSPDKTGRYISIEDPGYSRSTVYLSSYSLANYAGQTMEDFVSLTVFSAYESNGTDAEYFEDNSLVAFTQIIMTGRRYDGSILSFTMADQSVTYTYYKMNIYSVGKNNKYNELLESPTNDDRVYEVFDLIVSGFAADSVYGFYPDEEEIKGYGLDNDWMYIVYQIGSVYYRIEIGDKQADGLYPVMVNNNQIVYGVSAETLSFLTYGYTDYYRAQLYLCNIKEMDRIRVKTADMDYTFVITQTLTDKENDTYSQTAALKDGKSVDISLLRSFLAKFMQLQALGHTEEVYADVGKADVTITISYVDDEIDDDVITLYKYTDRRYLYRTNGTGDSLVKSDSVDSILSGVLSTAKSAS